MTRARRRARSRGLVAGRRGRHGSPWRRVSLRRGPYSRRVPPLIGSLRARARAARRLERRGHRRRARRAGAGARRAPRRRRARTRPQHVLGVLDGAACWAVDLDGDGVPDIVDGLLPLMALLRAGRRRALDARRSRRAARRVGPHARGSAVAAPRRPSRRRGSGPGAARLRAARLPASGPRGHHARSSATARRCWPTAARSRADVQLHRRVRRAGRDARGGGAPRGASRRWAWSWPTCATSPASRGRSRTRSCSASRRRGRSGEISIDEHEIVHAAWFRADDLPAIPPGLSIARRLIDDWVRRMAVG